MKSGNGMYTIWAQFHGLAYPKHKIGAYGSRKLCAYGKRISRVGSEFLLLRVRTPCYLPFYLRTSALFWSIDYWATFYTVATHLIDIAATGPWLELSTLSR